MKERRRRLFTDDEPPLRPAAGGGPARRRAAPRRPMIDRLIRFLNEERAAGRESLEDRQALPIGERVEAGECIAGLVHLGDRNGDMVFECAENHSKFKPGDGLILGTGEDPRVGAEVDYVGYDAATQQLVLRRNRWNTSGWGDLDLAGPLALDRRHSDFAQVVLDALAAIRAGHDPRARRIASVLDRSARPLLVKSETAWADAALEKHSLGHPLDASQIEAFRESFARRDFHLVQGPPGSGKTHLLACLVASWVRMQRRVLVTAYTHRAVNNVLSAVAAIDPSLRAVKIGRDHGAEGLPRSVRRVPGARKLEPPRPGRGEVVGVTIFAQKGLWDREPFDHVVFDEAAQIPIPHAVCGMLAGNHYVFVGDHRQLGPIVEGEHEDGIARLSIFEHLLGEGGDSPGYDATLLRTTYRMNDGINDFPSRHFYGGKLEPAEANRKRRFDLKPGGPLDDVLDPERPATLAIVRHEGFRRRSPVEARVVVDLLEDLLHRQGLDAGDVAVVTPYRAQVRAIRSLLQERIAETGPWKGVRARGASARTRGDGLPLIDTVERMQGQQREVMIVSLVCSEPEHAAREARFLFSPNRLNVTLTRARSKLVVIASPRLFDALPQDLEHLRHANLMARMFRELPKVDVTSRIAG